MTAQAGSSRNRGPAGDEYRAQLRTLSRALRDVHRSLVVVSRERYETDNGPVQGKGQLFDLLLRDETFAWLRPLSRLIVSIDELAARRAGPGEGETAAIRREVERFISPTQGPDEFGGRYTALLAVEPRVALNHGVLHEAIDGLPESKRPDRSRIGTRSTS